jgi:hypothetical protein
LAAAMSNKRSAPDSLGFGGNREPKRFKASPANAFINSLQPHVTALLKMFSEMPSDLIIIGLDNAIDNLLNEALLATPATYDNTIQGLDSQIQDLTEATQNGKVEAKYAFLATRMQSELIALRELLPTTHDDLQSANQIMPSPSVFAKDWVEAQNGPHAILCLRPPARQGLPLVTLHRAFLFFVNEFKKPLPMTEVDALKAAVRLCTAMAKPYESEPERRDAFNLALDPYIPRGSWLPQISLGDQPGMTGQLDGALEGYPLLREDREEIGSNGDPHMKIARGFQAYVLWRESQQSDEGKAGVAKFLLVVSGASTRV